MSLTITTAINGPVTLTAGNNPVSIASNGSIGGAAVGIYGSVSGTTWIVTNQGSVTAQGQAASGPSAGILLEQGGSIANLPNAVISGYGEGVYVYGGVATVTNAGTISGTAPNVLSSVGVLLESGGTVSNTAITGTISGVAGGVGFGAPVSLAAGSVSNSGLITSSQGYGVQLAQGGTVTNNLGATIYGYTEGVNVSGGVNLGVDPAVNLGIGVVDNYGTITANQNQGVYLNDGGSVVNGSLTDTTASISGGNYGVAINDSDSVNSPNVTGTVTNFGTITDTNASGTGVKIGSGGTVTNMAGAQISAGYGVNLDFNNSTLINAGTVTGSGANTIAVQINGTNDRVIVDPGAVFNGIVAGDGPTTTVELASSASSGVLVATGGKFTDFSALNIDSGARWTIQGDSALSSEFAQIGGFTVGDTISLTGLASTPTTFSSSTAVNSGTTTTSVIIKAGSTGLETLTLLGSIASSSFTFVAGTTSTLTETAPATNTFDAHVYLDTNADGVQDGGETGAAGITVNLLDGSGNPTGQSLTTNVSGNVSFTGLADGTYEIGVVTPSGDVATQTTNLNTPDALSAGETANATEGYYVPPALTNATIDLTVAQGQSLGNLWTELIANGVDPNPGSLSIVSVGTTGTQGSVSLSTGTDSLTYIATGFNPSSPIDSFTYTLEDGSSGTVTGTVDVTVTGPNLPTTTVTTPGGTGTATGSGQRLISEGTGQTLNGSSAGGDQLFGGPDTTINAKGSGNTIAVEPGNHSITMGANNNTLTLNNGNNSVIATGTGNTVTGGNGNDSISGMTGTATITLGNGNDTVTVSGAGNNITVGTGTNKITAGNGGNETVVAGNGANTISGGGTGDSFTGGTGTNKITATGANAMIVTGSGSPSDGAATIVGSGAGDQITTGGGNDSITVTAGSATIKAGLGSNTIKFGGSGNDVINQGGTDTLTDTGTNNTIVLPLAGQGMDTINGPVLSNGDTFDLRAALAATTWDQQLSELGGYLTMGTSGSNTLVQLSVTSGGTPITIAVLNGQGSVSLSSFVAHALLT